MTTIAERLRSLSPEKRRILERQLAAEGIELERIQISPRPADRPHYPLSFAQQRLWFLHQMAPESTAYHAFDSRTLRFPVAARVLEAAFNEVVRRHEVLRATFAVVDDLPVQVIHPPRRLTICEIDLTRLEGDALARETRRTHSRVLDPAFDLEVGPLMRLALVRLQCDHSVCMLATHHLVSDFWSTEIFLRELTALYQAISQGRPSPLPELAIQYTDFAIWQREWFEDHGLREHLDYWQAHLEGAVTQLELPTDRPRGAQRSLAGNLRLRYFPERLEARLRALAAEERTTMFVPMLASYEALLGRLAGQDRFTVGSTIANRSRQEIQELIGFFVNTRVFVADLTGDPSFRQLLGRVRQEVLDAETHQDLPFEKLAEELHPARSADATPLFQVAFNLLTAEQEKPGQRWTISGLEVDLPFDLTLRVGDAPGQLRAAFFYRYDLFDSARISRMLGLYERLLAAVAEDPDAPLSAWQPLAPAERHQILTEWNDSERPRPAGGTVHGLFEAQVPRTPEAVAAVFGDQQISYRELDARSNRLAHYLARQGVGPEVPVGVFLERSLDLVVTLMGILKAGGAYIPLEPDVPEERLAFMVRDAFGPRRPLLATTSELAGSLPATGGTTLAIDRLGPALAGESAEPAGVAVDPANLCYLIYTSGSTGRPKGAMVDHRAVYNQILWLQELLGLAADDRVLQKTPIGFDVSVWELFWTLAIGARMVVAAPGGHQDAPYLAQLVDRAAVTTMHFVPSMLRIFLEHGGAPTFALRRLLVSGEALPRDLIVKYRARFAPPMLNTYGPSEGARATYHRVDPERLRTVDPIGRPVTNNRMRIVDRRLRPLPIGAHGELGIAGTVPLVRGYLDRPALTAERFVPEPWTDEPGSRLYRTGDLATFMADGNIEFLGRLDFQVKLRGMRVELGEIEAVLTRHSEVREAVVVAREETPGDQRLVAFLVAAENAEPGALASRLRDALRRALPAYMVPAAFAVLERMPLTPSGKIDRRALPAAGTGRADQERPFVAPRTEIERALAEIWAEVLGRERVGVHDNFFDLGGHSLLATQVVSRARRRLEVELPLRRIFESQALEELAAVVDAMLWAARPAPVMVGAAGEEIEEGEL